MSDNVIVCPLCSEEIKPGAIKCKHCKSLLNEKQVDASMEPTEGNDGNAQHNNTENSGVDRAENYKPDNKRWSLAGPESTFAGSNIKPDVIDKAKSNKSEPQNNILSDGQLKTPQNKNDYNTPTCLDIYSFAAGVSYFLSAIFIGLGFHKMFAYNNPDGRMSEAVNAYVGGDAYNYIINANYATAYFALAVFCAVIGMTAVLGYLSIKNEADRKTSNAKTE